MIEMLDSLPDPERLGRLPKSPKIVRKSLSRLRGLVTDRFREYVHDDYPGDDQPHAQDGG